jgi:hypothetical protein
MSGLRTVGTPISPGKTVIVFREDTFGPQTQSIVFTSDGDSVLLSLWVGSLSSGTLSVRAFTQADDTKEVEILAFPVISAPTTELLLQKAALALSRVRLEISATGTVGDLDIRAKALSAGETSAKILSAGSLETSSISIGTSPTLLIASSLTDRNGLTIKNFGGGGTLYLSEAQAKLPSSAWPVGPGEVWSLDVNAGVEIWAVSSSGTLDVRLAQSGD